MGLIDSIFKRNADAEPRLHAASTLAEYVKDTALQVASRATLGDFAGLSKPEVIVQEVRTGAVSLAMSAGRSGENGPATPISIEEAMIKVCDDFRRRHGIAVVPNIHYEDGDAQTAGFDVQDLPTKPERRAIIEKLGF